MYHFSAAISSGNRCGLGCPSTTYDLSLIVGLKMTVFPRTSPAIVYFPKGYAHDIHDRSCSSNSNDRVYVVSTPIIALYYTQLIGDAKIPPTLLAATSFDGMAVIGLSVLVSAFLVS